MSDGEHLFMCLLAIRVSLEKLSSTLSVHLNACDLFYDFIPIVYELGWFNSLYIVLMVVPASAFLKESSMLTPTLFFQRLVSTT